MGVANFRHYINWSQNNDHVAQYEQRLLLEMYETVTNSQYTLYNALCNVITVNCYCVSISSPISLPAEDTLHIILLPVKFSIITH